MKSLLIALSILGVSFAAHAGQQMQPLSQNEIPAMLELFDRANIKEVINRGVCEDRTATLLSVTHDMGAASWTVSQDGITSVEMNDSEIPTAIALFDRVGVKGRTDGVSMTDQATIYSSVCEIGQDTWTITFDDGK